MKTWSYSLKVLITICILFSFSLFSIGNRAFAECSNAYKFTIAQVEKVISEPYVRCGSCCSSLTGVQALFTGVMLTCGSVLAGFASLAADSDKVGGAAGLGIGSGICNCNCRMRTLCSQNLPGYRRLADLFSTISAVTIRRVENPDAGDDPAEISAILNDRTFMDFVEEIKDEFIPATRGLGQNYDFRINILNVLVGANKGDLLCPMYSLLGGGLRSPLDDVASFADVKEYVIRELEKEEEKHHTMVNNSNLPPEMVTITMNLIDSEEHNPPNFQ
ncbi:MAG: hypothetical protein HQK53_15655 [Oligoflexia bacterium]|nr:hypothetical protein [Oligoflexia bacterium]